MALMIWNGQGKILVSITIKEHFDLFSILNQIECFNFN